VAHDDGFDVAARRTTTASAASSSTTRAPSRRRSILRSLGGRIASGGGTVRTGTCTISITSAFWSSSVGSAVRSSSPDSTRATTLVRRSAV